MNGVGVLLGLGVAGATPRPVGTTGGPLPADGVVRVAFEGVPQSLVTVDDGVVEGPVSLLETRCTTAKDRDTELCVFGFPEEVPRGVLSLQADALSTTVEVLDEVDIGEWTGRVQLQSTSISERTDPDIGEVIVDLDSVWDVPAAPAAGYVLEIRDEYGRAVDWRTIPVDAPASVAASTASEVLVSRGEICLRAAVADPLDREVWEGPLSCSDMPGQSDSTRRGCAVSPLGSTGSAPWPLALGLLLVGCRRR